MEICMNCPRRSAWIKIKSINIEDRGRSSGGKAEGIEKRLADSIENVLELADGLMMVDVIGGEPDSVSQSFSCPDCGISIDEIEPRSFSFNNPFGACPECFGLGYKMEFDEDLMIPDKRLSLWQREQSRLWAGSPVQ